MAKKIPKVKDNFGRFRKHATVVVSKDIEELAKQAEVNVKRQVRDELLKTYKTNVAQSYLEGYTTSGRGGHLSYHHTNNFLDSIHARIDGDIVKITIDDSIKYENGKSTYDIYTFLTHGTEVHEEGYNPFISGTKHTENGRTSVYKSAKRRPMERHLFEEHTRVDMIAYLDKLREKLKKHIETGDVIDKKYWKRGI